MKRMILVGIITCILLLSGSLTTEKAHAHQPAQTSEGKASSVAATTSSSVLSTSQLKDVVRKTLGQHAVDRMLYPVTHPLANRHPVHYNTTVPYTRVPASMAAMTGREVYDTSDRAAGYTADLGQTSTGASAQFNVESVAHPSPSPTITWVGLGYYKDSYAYFPVVAGVDQVGMLAMYQVGPINTSTPVDVFQVNNGDQVSSEVYQWNDNQWFIFIFDQTTGQYFNQIIFYSPGTTLTQAGWVLTVAPPGPLTSFLPVTFSQAIWVGNNSSGWQPITAARAYAQLFLQSPNGGRAWTTEIPTPPGNSFSVLYCPGCTP